MSEAKNMDSGAGLVEVGQTSQATCAADKGGHSTTAALLSAQDVVVYNNTTRFQAS